MGFTEMLDAVMDGGLLALLTIMLCIFTFVILPIFLRTLEKQRTELTLALNDQRKEFTAALKEAHEKCDKMVARSEEDHRRTAEAISQLSNSVNQLTLIVQMGSRRRGDWLHEDNEDTRL